MKSNPALVLQPLTFSDMHAAGLMHWMHVCPLIFLRKKCW